ncbi:MAG: hypothetical protein M0Z99_34330 [Betaproteobacteria bacterium]|nr:hypothetical protein [Betaproteobacteria bacterium]
MATKKRVQLTAARPTQAPTADAWVSAPTPSEPTAPAFAVATPKATAQAVERMSRLTVDLPESLHRRLKARCAVDGLRMVDVVRDALTKFVG